MSETSPPTLGSKIDALLSPFVEDEAKLQQRLAAIHDEAERLKVEMKEVNEDLAVVQAAKVDALRQAAEADPLLSAVFGSTSAPKLVVDEADESDEPEIEVVEGDGHPLLSHAS
ncbi:MAG: hypothetical protein AAF086_04725 [Planctomycetota bacterium]